MARYYNPIGNPPDDVVDTPDEVDAYYGQMEDALDEMRDEERDGR